MMATDKEQFPKKGVHWCRKCKTYFRGRAAYASYLAHFPCKGQETEQR